MARGRVENFEAEIFRVAREAAQPAIESGIAQIETAADGGGTFLRLRPNNPKACEIHIYPDYPTLCMGPEGHTTEMFGTEQERLQQLPKLICAVIAGRYEWEHRQVSFLRLFRFTELRGTFHTEDGPWVFTRQGGEPPSAVEQRSYEPY